MTLKKFFNIFNKFDKKILITTAILFSLGLLMIYSSSNVTAIMNDASPGRYFQKELVFLIFGLLACSIFIFFNTKSYYKLFSLGLVIIGVSMFLLFLYGKAVNGATNWIGYKGLGIQPSEFAKIFIIPYFAFYYERYKKDCTDFKKMLFPVLVGVTFMGFMVMQNDYGTALIFSLLVAFLFYLSPVALKIKKNVTIVGLVAILVFVIAVFTIGDKFIDADKLARFDYFNPCDKYLTTGNQLCNGYIAMNSGGLIGKGLGDSTQKYLYLPEGHTDFIFAIFVEELGFLGALVLFVLYGFLIFKIYKCGRKAVKGSHKMICYGVAAYIFIHILTNLGGVLGIIPLTGVPLIFMSYGGSICWSTLLAICLVQRVSYETNLLKSKK